jgi:hypothetical protein
MMFKKQISLFVATFFIIGFFFVALPEKGYSGVPTELGCCTVGPECIGCEPLNNCAISTSACIDIGGDGIRSGEVCASGAACPPPQGLGCCVISEGNCFGEGILAACELELGMAWFENADCSEVPQCPQAVVSPIPTLSEWGLIAMVAVLGIVGFMVIRRRKVTA